jgi:hypothetical protein
VPQALLAHRSHLPSASATSTAGSSFRWLWCIHPRLPRIESRGQLHPLQAALVRAQRSPCCHELRLWCINPLLPRIESRGQLHPLQAALVRAQRSPCCHELRLWWFVSTTAVPHSGHTFNMHNGIVVVCVYGWTGQETGSGFCDLAPSILHYNWF